MTRALLLDLDGTLVDSIPCWIDAYRETLATFGRPLGQAEFLATIYQRSASVSAVLESLQVGVSEAEFRRVRDGRYLEYLGSRVAWLPGAEVFLADAARPLGIVTNSWRAYVDAIDRHLGVRSRVDTLVDLEDAGDRPKPHGYPLELAAERLGAEAARCIYVGDQAHDMAAARAAGMEAWLLQRPETPEAAVGLADMVLTDLLALAAAWAADA